MKKKKSISGKYLRAFILIIILPTLLISFILNRVYISTLLENSSDVIQHAMEQIAIGVENEIRRISLSASTISNDDEIMDLVTKWNRSDDLNTKFDISNEIDRKLNYIFSNSSDVESVIFFFDNPGAYYFKNYPLTEEEEIKNMDWYKATIQNRGKVLIPGSLKSFTVNSWNQYVFSTSISPDISYIRNDVEVVFFSFRTNIFSSFYSNFKLASEGQLFIVDENYKIMVSKNEELIGKDIYHLGFTEEDFQTDSNSFVDNVNQGKVFVSVRDIEKIGWKIISMIDYKELTQDVDRISAYAAVVIIVILLFFLGFSVYFFRDLILPIKNMINKMKNVEKGDFNTTIDIERNDELSDLGRSFNRMVQEIKKLIVEIDIKERERSKEEIEVLQSQINPHFLSNTLNSIRLMAMIAKVESIKNMTDAFIKLLSASFAKSGKLISIEEEIDNLNNYIYIMKIRYGDKFNCNINIDNDIKKMYVLRLILQPIVENSILHGISDMEDRGEIAVTGYKEDGDIIFKVKDNGVGMTKDQIDRLLKEDKRNAKGFSSIGIMNVDRRIKLNHGMHYGLKIESIFGEYTLVKMVLPCIYEHERDELNV